MSSKDSLRVLSCIQPTSEMHIGNYFGAIENWVVLQESHECMYGIADLHAMTATCEQLHLRENTERMLIDLLACGIDPDKSLLFIQSLVPEHTELSWILGCFCPHSELESMNQFKAKSRQVKRCKADNFISAGLFVYPVLQAADILIYQAQYVPVGNDQEQHLKLSRSIAQRFNRRFGTFFLEPEPLFTPTPQIMSLTDPTQKMSKSLGAHHYIGLFEDEQSIRDKVKAAVTDPILSSSNVEMSPGVINLFNILKACGKWVDASELTKDHFSGKREYSVLKEMVANALVELTSRFRQKRDELLENVASIRVKVLEASERAREIARENLRSVQSLIGLPVRY